MATETKTKYVDINPSEWPPQVQQVIAAYFAAKDAVGPAITAALQSVGQCPADKQAVIGFNYGKIGLGLDADTGRPATKAASVTKAFSFAGAQPPAAPAPAAAQGKTHK